MALTSGFLTCKWKWQEGHERTHEQRAQAGTGHRAMALTAHPLAARFTGVRCSLVQSRSGLFPEQPQIQCAGFPDFVSDLLISLCLAGVSI